MIEPAVARPSTQVQDEIAPVLYELATIATELDERFKSIGSSKAFSDLVASITKIGDAFATVAPFAEDCAKSITGVAIPAANLPRVVGQARQIADIATKAAAQQALNGVWASGAAANPHLAPAGLDQPVVGAPEPAGLAATAAGRQGNAVPSGYAASASGFGSSVLQEVKDLLKPILAYGGGAQPLRFGQYPRADGIEAATGGVAAGGVPGGAPMAGLPVFGRSSGGLESAGQPIKPLPAAVELRQITDRVSGPARDGLASAIAMPLQVPPFGGGKDANPVRQAIEAFSGGVPQAVSKIVHAAGPAASQIGRDACTQLASMINLDGGGQQSGAALAKINQLGSGGTLDPTAPETRGKLNLIAPGATDSNDAAGVTPRPGSMPGADAWNANPVGRLLKSLIPPMGAGSSVPGEAGPFAMMKRLYGDLWGHTGADNAGTNQAGVAPGTGGQAKLGGGGSPANTASPRNSVTVAANFLKSATNAAAAVLPFPEQLRRTLGDGLANLIGRGGAPTRSPLPAPGEASRTAVTPIISEAVTAMMSVAQSSCGQNMAGLDTNAGTMPIPPALRLDSSLGDSLFNAALPVPPNAMSGIENVGRRSSSGPSAAAWQDQSPAGHSKALETLQQTATAVAGSKNGLSIRLDDHALGRFIQSYADRLIGGPNTGPSSVNSSQIYAPAGIHFTGHN